MNNTAPPIYQPTAPAYQVPQMFTDVRNQIPKNFQIPTFDGTKLPMKEMISDSKTTIMQVLKNVRIIKFGVTAFLLAWLAYFSYQILKPDDENVDKSNWFNLHRIWFGDESIVFILFKIWYMVIVFLAISPIIGEIINLLQNPTLVST